MADNTPSIKYGEFSETEFSKRVKISGTKELKNGVLQIALTFNTTEFGDLIVKGFRVSRSLNYDGYWVQPPSVKKFTHYCELFRATEPVWKDIQELLIKTYKECFAVNDINLDDVDLGDIDIEK